jgi:hypothetical protein
VHGNGCPVRGICCGTRLRLPHGLQRPDKESSGIHLAFNWGERD